VIKVVISGQAGVYAILATTAVVYDLNGRSFELSSNDWPSAFERCTDVRVLSVRSQDDARTKCQELRNADRALRFLLHLLEEDATDRIELAAAFERLLASGAVKDAVSASLYVDALPSTDSAVRILEEFRRLPQLSSLLKIVLLDQKLIRKVREQLEQCDSSNFENADAYASFRSRIFQSYTQRELVHLLRDNKSIEPFVADLKAQFASISGAARAIDTWTVSFHTKPDRLPRRLVLGLKPSNQLQRASRIAFRTKPTVIVVGADKGGVGKTTVSRTLLDYFNANNVMTRAFDTESPRGTLKRFHPDITEIVDVTTLDQMKIFDTLNSASPSVTVIDVRAGLLSPALASLRDIGFLDAAKSGQINFAVFHILGPSIASLDEIAEIANFMQGAKHFLVKNFISNTSFFEWDQATYNSYFHRIKDATEITIPKLNEMAYEQVEVSSVPFLNFIANKGTHDEAANYSFVMRGYVRDWLANVWSEFDRIHLTDIVGKDGSKRDSGNAEN
jgi:hypothetical protein